MIETSDVRHIAKLARLHLENEEETAFAEQLDRILGFFDELKAIDTTGVPETAHPFPVSNALREDVVRPSLPVDAVLANAPHREADYFRVPKILDS